MSENEEVPATEGRVDRRRESDRQVQRTVQRVTLFVKAAPIMFFAGLVMMVVGAVLSYGGLTTINRLDEDARDQCVRVQTLRSGVNGLSRLVYETTVAAAEANMGMDNTEREQLGAEFFAHIAQDVKFQPKTNCKLAIEYPDSYEPPKPMPMWLYLQDRPPIERLDR